MPCDLYTTIQNTPMTKRENESKAHIEGEEIMDEVLEEVESVSNDDGEIDEDLLNQIEELKDEESETVSDNDQINALKESLARQQADYVNFQKRTARDKDEMVFFIKSKIINPILKRLDDIERIIKNTPETEQNTPVFQAVLALEKALNKDLSDMGVVSFVSLWESVDPNKHDVMTQIPWEEWKILDEFEKWYTLDAKVLRVATVVVGSWA